MKYVRTAFEYLMILVFIVGLLLTITGCLELGAIALFILFVYIFITEKI